MKILGASIALILSLLGCNKTHGPEAGSQTHFLEVCSGDCAAPYSCLCGVCSLSCSNDSACTSAASGAQCVEPAAAAGGVCDDPVRMCDVECTTASDCSAFGSGFSCVAGRCRSSVALGDAAVATNLCDGSSDMRLGLQVGGGFVSIAYAFTNPYGLRFAFVDGQCHFYASSDYLAGIVTGTLSESEAVQLANEVGWSQLPALSYADQACPDAGATQILRPGTGVYCSCGCDDTAPVGLAGAIDKAATWMDTLGMRGTPLSGPVRVLAYHTNTGGEDAGAPPGFSTEWPLMPKMTETMDLIAPDGGTAIGAVFSRPGDATTLRELRASALTEQSMTGRDFVGVQEDQMFYQLFIRDELPDGVDARITALINSAPLPTP